MKVLWAVVGVLWKCFPQKCPFAFTSLYRSLRLGRGAVGPAHGKEVARGSLNVSVQSNYRYMMRSEVFAALERIE
jgi:hypothetical protein